MRGCRERVKEEYVWNDEEKRLGKWEIKEIEKHDRKLTSKDC